MEDGWKSSRQEMRRMFQARDVGIFISFRRVEGFPGCSDDKESACSAGDTRDSGLISECRRFHPGRREWLPTPVFLGGIINTMDMKLSKLWEIVKDREAWHAAVHGVTRNWHN